MNETERQRKIWRWVGLGLVMAALLAGLIILAVKVMTQGVLGLDRWWQDRMLSIRAGWLNTIMILITHLVNPLTLAAIGFALLFLAKRQRSNSLLWFLSLALTSVVNLVLKTFFMRARPDVTLAVVQEAGYSFPSGHAMTAVAAYGWLLYLLWHTDWKAWVKWLLTVGDVLLIMLIGLSRTYLGVHYLSDIVAGNCAATLVLIILMLVVACCRRLVAGQNDYKQHSFWAGFKYALSGLCQAFKTEYNLTIQFACAMLAVVFGVCLKISAVEWCLIIILCFLILTLELINTALENVCDQITTEHHPRIKYIKDVAAGAVLMMSIGAAIVGAIIFLPKIAILF